MPSVSSEEWFPTPGVIDCTETESNLEWRELLELHATGNNIARGRLKAALSHGIPPALRPQAWLSFSGCTEWMRRHPMVYDQLCTRVERGGSGAPAASVREQIEKDLRRTEAGTSGAKLEALRRVLQAFASFNPTIGYVQGMNFIAAGLLRVLPEAAAFWMLVLIEQEYLPAHFGESMTGNHVDCRVLSRLTSEHLPRLSAKLKALDASLQLLTARWFLCFWASCVSVDATHRLWDLLFVCGPPSIMQVALACLHAVEQQILTAPDLGTAISSAKEVLVCTPVAQLVHRTLYEAAEISQPQLAAWRSHCHGLVAKEAAALQATRGLVHLQRISGFSMGEIRSLAQYCAGASETPASMLAIAIDYATFELLVCTVVPGWNNGCPLLDRLFRIFAAQPSGGKGSSEGGGEALSPGGRTPLRGWRRGLLQTAGGAAARVAASLAGGSSDGASLTLWFDQLVCGLGWLLRGDSERRSQLCFACFDVEGDGAVQREAFSTLLQGVYLLYEPPMQAQTAAHDARVAAVGAEAREFVGMMYDLWADRPDGTLDAVQFRRAAHQHPLLVQAFQLAALDAELTSPHDLDAELAAPRGHSSALATKPTKLAAPAAPAAPPAAPVTPRTPTAPPVTCTGAIALAAAPTDSTAGGMQTVSSTYRVPRRSNGVVSGTQTGLLLTMRAASATTVYLCFESSSAAASPSSRTQSVAYTGGGGPSVLSQSSSRLERPSWDKQLHSKLKEGSVELSPRQALTLAGNNPQILFDYFQ